MWKAIAIALLLGVVGLEGQATLPKIPDIQVPVIADVNPPGDLMPRWLAAEISKQCPTCATIDTRSGAELLVPTNGARVYVDAPTVCSLPAWEKTQATLLKQAIEHALKNDAATLTGFHASDPGTCDKRAFVYYLEIARQLLPNPDVR